MIFGLCLASLATRICRAGCYRVQAMNSCHLCGIAARLGRTVKWDPKGEKFVGDDLSASLFARVPRPGYEILRV